MPLTFGDQLKLFALSVDVVDEARFSRVKRLIDEYCRETLGIEVTKLHVASSDVDGQPGLRRYGMGALDEESSSTLRKSDGSYKSQSTLAYDKRKPLWIVSNSGKQKLGNGAQCRDLWSRLRSVPPYRAGSSGVSGEIKTSIIVPISNGDEVLGVLNFETSDYIEITDEAKTELTKIAETLGILIRLFRAANAQKSSTENVVFEAGMFHGRVDEITPTPTSWVPIREKPSPDLPFDFAQERILWVERSNKGELKTKSFASALRGRLDALLSLP